MFVESVETSHIVVGCPKEETIVHVAFLCCQREFLIKCFEGGGLRHGIGHIEETGHTPSRSGTTLTVDICLLRQSRLTEMYMIVDDTWEYKTSRSIDDLVNNVFGTRFSFYNLTYLSTFDDY